MLPAVQILLVFAVVLMFIGWMCVRFNKDGSDFASGLMGLVFLMGLYIFSILTLAVLSGEALI